MEFSLRLQQIGHRYRDTFLKTPLNDTGGRDKLIHNPRSGATYFRLPSEITAKIFKFAQLHYSDALGVEYDEWCWITITHVCRLWREVAIGTHDLWTYLDIERLSGIEQTAVYLARSGTSELVVHCGHSIHKVDPSETLQSFFLTLTHLHRIRELYIWNLPGQQLSKSPKEVQIALFQSAAPALQKFTYFGKPSEIVDVKMLFRGEAPKLAGFSLFADSHTWVNAPIIRNLIYLRMGTQIHRPNVKEIYSILINNPNIKAFYPGAVQSEANSRLLPTSICLPFLEDIEIIACYSVLSQLFGSIVTPNLVGWDIRCQTYPQTVRLDARANHRTIIPQTYLEKGCESVGLQISSSYILLNSHFSNWEDRYNKSSPRRKLLWSWKDEGGGEVIPLSIVEEFDVACSVIEGGFWSSARDLRVEFDIHISRTENLHLIDNLGYQPWMRLLLSFPELEKLSMRRFALVRAPIWLGGSRSLTEVLHSDTHRGLLEALKSTLTDSNDEGKCRLVAPRLEELRVTGMNFEHGSSFLVEILRIRTSCGIPIRRLLLEQPFGVTDAILRDINQRELVESVEINGGLLYNVPMEL